MFPRQLLFLGVVASLLPACAPSTEAPAVGSRSQALSASHGCFSEHLREAIALNRERREHYATLTGGLSRGVSDLLIASEVLMLPVAAVFDARARWFQRAGIPIMCDDFMPMSDAAPLQTERGPRLQVSELVETWDGSLQRDIVLEAYNEEGFGGAARELEAALSVLATAPSFMCMTRHMLESALRAANLAPGYLEASRTRRMAWLGPDDLSRDFLWLQLQALPAAHTLDRLAAPLQADGVGIVCRDVPPIPAH